MSGSSLKILVVEDQEKLVYMLKRGLTEMGLAVTCVETAVAADEALSRSRFDVVVLDLMLPDRDGLDLLRQWRHRRMNFPILILSARNAVRDRIQGLEDGADDYLPKPFSMEELYARIRALTRRKGEVELELRHRGLSFNPRTRAVMLNEQPVEMTRRELALLEIFLQHTGRTLTRGMLTEKVWAMDYDVDSNLLDAYMSRLRAKLEIPGERPFFETIRGMGYKMV